jgi:hypothetical protein
MFPMAMDDVQITVFWVAFSGRFSDGVLRDKGMILPAYYGAMIPRVTSSDVQLRCVNIVTLVILNCS